MGAAQGNKVEFTPWENIPGGFRFTLLDEAGNSHEYLTTRLGVSRARAILPHVSSLVGAMMAGMEGPDAAMFSLAGALEGADFGKFDKLLLETTVRDGQKLSNAAALDAISVTGGMGEYTKLVMAVLELNFAGVFTAGIERLAGARFLEQFAAASNGGQPPSDEPPKS